MEHPKPIEMERWKPDPHDPRRVVYDGQRTGLEVFDELEYRLKAHGLLPDEYFIIDTDWENGREIPKDADVFVTTDYGGSEGVYLDVYLKWREEGKAVTKSFATGKTLGESGADLDRMHLISSAIVKAFHGEGHTIGLREPPLTLSLSTEDRSGIYVPERPRRQRGQVLAGDQDHCEGAESVPLHGETGAGGSL